MLEETKKNPQRWEEKFLFCKSTNWNFIKKDECDSNVQNSVLM